MTTERLKFPDSLCEKLLFTTARIEVLNAIDKASILGHGTCFFFEVKVSDSTKVPVIVTNRHVVEDFSLLRILLTQKNSNGEPDLRHRIELYIEQYDETLWHHHPDPKVDLTFMLLGPSLSNLKAENKEPYIQFLSSSIIPTVENWLDLDAVEEILMIGYPNGLWDSVHNRPIVRRGITASHPAVAFKGEKEFLIDAACFPGSSGSPIFLYNSHSYREKRKNSIIIGTRFYFLGVLRAGPQYNIKGELETVNTTITNDTKVIYRIPNNLGFVIRSDILLDFVPVIDKILSKHCKL